MLSAIGQALQGQAHGMALSVAIMLLGSLFRKHLAWTLLVLEPQLLARHTKSVRES